MITDVVKAAVLVTLAAVVQVSFVNSFELIEGHADSDGTEEHNLTLSENRARSVANYLAGQQVMESRFTTMGYGESQPIASNDTAAGKAQNRRVEVAIYANDDLKKEAEKKVESGS